MANKTERVNIRLTPEEADRLKALTDSLGIGAATYVRTLVIRDLDDYRKAGYNSNVLATSSRHHNEEDEIEYEYVTGEFDPF